MDSLNKNRAVLGFYFVLFVWFGLVSEGRVEQEHMTTVRFHRSISEFFYLVNILMINFKDKTGRSFLVCSARRRGEALYHSYGRYEEPLNGSLLFMSSNEVRSILVCGTGLH